jgi:short-subunit dehydrogenase involved in D-alanine esterification of teichoic acids
MYTEEEMDKLDEDILKQVNKEFKNEYPNVEVIPAESAEMMKESQQTKSNIFANQLESTIKDLQSKLKTCDKAITSIFERINVL